MDKKILKLCKIVDLHPETETPEEDKKIKHFDFIQIDNIIISVVTLKPLFTDSDSSSSGKNPNSSDDDEQLLSVS